MADDKYLTTCVTTKNTPFECQTLSSATTPLGPSMLVVDASEGRKPTTGIILSKDCGCLQFSFEVLSPAGS